MNLIEVQNIKIREDEDENHQIMVVFYFHDLGAGSVLRCVKDVTIYLNYVI